MKVRHYRTRQILDVTSTSPLQWKESRAGGERCIPWLAPSLVDVQVNGFGGTDFNKADELTPESWKLACDALYAHGCTHFLAAVITHAPKEYAPLAEALEKCRRAYPANCAGYHLEGPFLNPHSDYSRAHNPDWMKPADWKLVEAWQKASRGAVRLVTLAPETDWKASELFGKQAIADGIRLAAGHSSLMGADLDRALNLGITGWTHLGNAVPTVTHKFENVIWHVLAQESLLATMIPDGRHVPPHVFKSMAKILERRLLLTTDAMAGAGATPGRRTLGWLEMEIGADAVARIPGKENYAGSTLTPFDGVFKAAAMSHLPWQEMWDAFSVRPAAWLGWKHECVAASEGNFCLFLTEPEPKLLTTYHRGRKVFSSPDADSCQIFPE